MISYMIKFMPDQGKYVVTFVDDEGMATSYTLGADNMDDACIEADALAFNHS